MPVISLTIMDSLNRERTKQLVTELTTVAAIQTFLDAYLPLWAGVSGLGIQRADVVMPLTVSPQTPAANSNIDEGATFNVTTGDTYKTGFKIPGILDALRLPGGAIDLAALGVTNFFADYLTGDARVNKNNPTTVTVVNSGVLDK